MTPSSGLNCQFRNGEEADQFTILESLGGGVALLDYDRDGLLDIFVIGGGHFGAGNEILGYPNRLYHNEGNWKFRDVSAEAGLPLHGQLRYCCGCAAADFDNDGWTDLLVTGYGGMTLYRNIRGRFRDVTAAAQLQIPQEAVHWSTSAAWGDLNGDGWPDLFVAHYVDWSFLNHPRCPGERRPHDVCPPSRFQPLPHRLFFGNGGGTFRDGSRDAGLKAGAGLGTLIADLDDDGRPDIYVANDGGGNLLYLNQGRNHFVESGLRCSASCDETGAPGGSMGVDAADYDGSGRLSIFVTNFVRQTHFLFRNLGHGDFQNVSRPAGITALGMNDVGFGTAFLDWDNDGVEDLVISNGHVLRFANPPQSLQQRAVLLRNTRQSGDVPSPGRFEDISAHGGSYFSALHRGRGLAVGDLDNDGKADLVISHCNEPITLLRNIAGNRHHWLGVQLVGRPNRDAAGARLVLELNGKKLVRVVKGGGSYLSSSDRRVLFGLGSATAVDKLTVYWPWGQSQTWDGRLFTPDRYWLVRQGEQTPTTARPLQAQ